MGKSKRQYINNVAQMVATRTGILKDYEELMLQIPNSFDFAKKFWERYGSKIVEVMAVMTPEARGRIAACGSGYRHDELDPTPHWEMEVEVNTRQTANEQLTQLAAAVVAAAIVDIFVQGSYNREYDDACAHLFPEIGGRRSL